MSSENKPTEEQARELGVIFARMRREAQDLVDEINRPGWVKEEFARLLREKTEEESKRKKQMHMAQASQSVRLRHRHIMRTSNARNNYRKAG